MRENLETTRLDHLALEDFSSQLFQSCGVNSKNAELTARSLVWADLRGVYSHGVVRLQPSYLQSLTTGMLNPTPQISTVADGPAFAILDGDGGLGQTVANDAMAAAIEKARVCGIGLSTVFNGRHFGAAAYWPMLAAEQQMIGFSCSNGAKVNTAPYGGARSSLGNNPHAWVFPAGSDRPVILDMATGVAAFGKVMMARLHRMPLPEGWCLDADGNDTTNADAAVTMLPAGGPKGYAIGYVFDLLSGALSGALTSTIKSLGGVTGQEAIQSGMTFMAINVAAMTDYGKYEHVVDENARLMRQTVPRPGFERVFVPGEIEWSTYDDRIDNGIPTSDAELGVLTQMGADHGVATFW